MSDITNLIKDLRNKTGAGFLDCKNALSQNENDIEKSIEYLRKKGLSKASKKSSREANEGAVGVFSNNKTAIIIKITDMLNTMISFFTKFITSFAIISTPPK